MKLHAVVGTRTNVVAACAVTDKEQHDSPMLPQLVAEAARQFGVKEVSADKGYCGRDNFPAECLQRCDAGGVFVLQPLHIRHPELVRLAHSSLPGFGYPVPRNLGIRL